MAAEDSRVADAKIATAQKNRESVRKWRTDGVEGFFCHFEVVFKQKLV